ncbi:MAG: CRISPR system precrRNA processing endoribonuclease RAMP protein Cas6 [Roseiarcus sp.]
MTTGWCERIRAESPWFRPLGDIAYRAASLERRALMAAELADPPLRFGPTALAALFAMDVVTIVGARPKGLQDFPELAVRVRGALGRVLHGFGPPILDRHDPAARPRAWDVLFEPMEAPGGRGAIAKPLVVRADVIGDRVIASVGLVGAAGFWRPDAAAALAGALEGGVAGWEDGRIKLPIPCLEARHERVAGFVAPTYSVREARLTLRTPFRLRSGGALVSIGPSFLIAIANRAARLAPWMHARLDVDWDRVHAQAQRIEVATEDLLPYRWSRGTQRARTRVPMIGYLGRLVFRGPLDSFVPFLQIAAAANAGSHASLGLGRFDLALLP